MTNNSALDPTTIQACIEVARKVQRARHLSGDENGSDAARQVAAFLAELLEGTNA